ncbi:hypothetical protein FHR83_009318 [Actinoplanes campanulatus]|uniref:DUF4352 domain-containing protein n=1 Tax=Actinoplanes campanulatus TaxID=113559 RepID=A0A7W5FKA5_9ACTN|nr:DUF4352 domain-containing protein [Actinoplanes campanulatus]MBB3101589.1 hypothetical protein [Actinoplanes campanulatus]GGN51489.1 Mpr protein [Actinoplanes campanulatus]GID42632.1 Mpr protein [Actinoplanes campanulatus]
MADEPGSRRRPDPAAYRPLRRTPTPFKVAIALVVSGVVVIALFAAGIVAERVSRDPAVTAADTPAKTHTNKTKKPSGIGDPVRDGKFEFVVSHVDCSRAIVGTEHLRRTAQGRYCVVTLSVRNIADEPKYFLGLAQKARDVNGADYGYDEIAGLYANRDTETFLEKLDPGERVTGKLVFDIPDGVGLAALELHDSPLSGGVTVTL